MLMCRMPRIFIDPILPYQTIWIGADIIVSIEKECPWQMFLLAASLFLTPI